MLVMIGIFLILSALLGLGAGSIGFAFALWYIEPKRAAVTPPAPGTADPVHHAPTADQLAHASCQLIHVAHAVADDVSQHSLEVESISDELRRLDQNSIEAAAAIIAARDQIMAINTHLRKRLESAERQIESQAEQLQAYKIEARTDLVTGIANRRAFEIELQKRMAEWQRKSTPFSILMLDIDHFKQFNDCYGHQQGDLVLKKVSCLLVDQARTMDVVCRYGGEEFALLLPFTTVHDACIVAERIRDAIERLTLDHCDGATATITVSIGVAEVENGDRTAGLLRRADTAMYAAKQGGRNCVRSYVEDASSNSQSPAEVVSI